MTDLDKHTTRPLGLGEAASVIGCSVKTVRRLIRAGLLDGFSLSGNTKVKTRTTAGSVRRYLETRGR